MLELYENEIAFNKQKKRQIQATVTAALADGYMSHSTFFAVSGFKCLLYFEKKKVTRFTKIDLKKQDTLETVRKPKKVLF